MDLMISPEQALDRRHVRFTNSSSFDLADYCSFSAAGVVHVFVCVALFVCLCFFFKSVKHLLFAQMC